MRHISDVVVQGLDRALKRGPHVVELPRLVVHDHIINGEKGRRSRFVSGPVEATWPDRGAERDQLLPSIARCLRRRGWCSEARPSASLWRAGDANSFPAWWLARIEPGTYGFLAKLGGRCGWHVSDRDNTLATVPEELFDAAAEMTFARDR